MREFIFPGHDPGPRKWLNFISGLIDTATLYLQSASDLSIDPSTASKFIQDAEQLGDNAYALLMHVSGEDAGQIPHQIVAPFQGWVQKLQIENTIFFRAEHISNYELATFDLEQWCDDLNSPSVGLGAATTKINWPVLRVTVPGQAMGMLPHFAVVGHELGHAIQDEIKPDFSNYIDEDAALKDRIDARLAKNGHSFGDDQLMLTSEILKSWVNELKADAVGHLLSGPAFFFALCGFLEIAGQSYGISPSHPPSDLRRKLLLNQLNADSPSFSGVIQKKTGLVITETINSPHIPACPQGDDLFIDLLDEYNVYEAAICTELVTYLENISAEIYGAARTYLEALPAEIIYRPTQLELDIDAHLDLLCQLVPPIEYRDEQNAVRPSSLATILNVGWIALLTRLDRIPAPREKAGDDIDAAKMERLHELLLKAVELSEARRLWEEQG